MRCTLNITICDASEVDLNSSQCQSAIDEVPAVLFSNPQGCRDGEEVQEERRRPSWFDMGQ